MSEPSSESSSEPSGAKGDKDTAQASKPKQSLDNLPNVESPSISPVGDELKDEEAAKVETAKVETVSADEKPAATGEAEAPAPEAAAPAKVISFPTFTVPKIKVSRRFKRAAANAAVIAVAAGIGAIASALAIHSMTPVAAPRQVAASATEQQAIQKSIALLAKEVSTLKSNIETAGKSSQTQVSKTASRVDSARSGAEKPDAEIVTGSITTPKSVAFKSIAPRSAASDAIAAATVATIAAPLPLPQPRPQLVQGWSVHLAPDGMVLAEQRGGDLYQVAPGVPLPGLGRVEAVHRDGGRLEVVTSKGVIASSPRQTVRNRYYRFPPYFEPY